MYRLSIVIAIIATLVCTTTGNVVDDAQDRYVRAANSWLSASIGEMIAARGNLTRRFRLPKGEIDRIAWWESRSAKLGHDGIETILLHCSTVAYFNSNLIITNIEVKLSRDCHRLYENLFESMTRDRVKSDHTLIET